MRSSHFAVCSLISLLCYPSIAAAYIGPGLGVGAIATIFGIMLGLLMLIVGLIWYPIKRVISRNKKSEK